MRLSIRGARGFTRRLVLSVAVLLLVVLSAGLSGCASGSTSGWPAVQVIPSAVPADLEAASGTPKLVRGSDGFWYVVGVLGEEVQTGSAFMGRYSGDWPLENLPRPALANGRVLKRFSDQVALVGLTYWFPKSELATLEVTWEAAGSEETLGKGIGKVTQLAGAVQSSGTKKKVTAKGMQLDLGKEEGVQVGDIYAILKPVGPGAAPIALQLSRRLVAICRIENVGESGSDCVQLYGYGGAVQSSVSPRAVAQGDDVLFLEHTLEKKSRDAQIVIGQVAGYSEVQGVVLGEFASYLGKFTNANTKAVPSELEMDATNIDFHRNGRLVKYEGTPTLLVGLSVHEVKGKKHLFANYTGVGPATGPGMIAAPPEHGIDLGDVKKLKREQVRALASVVMGAMMVYRGQTSEAMMHLKSVLDDEDVQGALRWHVRDQFAMRWGALRYFEEALWLVMEDEAVAKADNDEQARLNALGTRVRLYDFVGLSDKAFEKAGEYLEARQSQKPNSAYLAALSMYGEMALGAKDEAAARKAVDELRALCPDGCEGDLVSFLGGIFWSVPPGGEGLQDELLGYLLEYSRDGDVVQRASVRLYQGIVSMREREWEQALVAFFEAERLFEQVHYVQGVGRTHYFMFLTDLAREEPQSAFEHALKSLEINAEVGDFGGVLRVYERMANLYGNIDMQGGMKPFLGAAPRVLSAAVHAQLATGDYASAAETMFETGGFFFKIGSMEQSQLMFQQTVWYGLRSARFDIVALSHLFLGMIARNQGDMESFREEIQRAILMGEIAKDPAIMEVIQNALTPKPENDVPTQLL